MPLSDEQRAIIAKLEHGLDDRFMTIGAPFVTAGPVLLTINERVRVAATLRHAWLSRKEWRAYCRSVELAQYAKLKDIAKNNVPRGQRQDWIQRYYGKSKETLKRYFVRKRHP
jgi:hypothetical protein